MTDDKLKAAEELARHILGEYQFEADSKMHKLATAILPAEPELPEVAVYRAAMGTNHGIWIKIDEEVRNEFYWRDGDGILRAVSRQRHELTDIQPLHPPSDKYERELTAVAELLTKHWPLREIKAVGMLECAAALEQTLQERSDKPPAPRELMDELEQFIGGMQFISNNDRRENLLAAVRAHTDPELPGKLRGWARAVGKWFPITASEMRQLAAKMEGK